MPQSEPAVIYRRSYNSVTFRCQQCGMQWTMTRAILHKVATALAAKYPDAPSVYATVADWTRGAAEHAALRPNTIRNRQRAEEVRKRVLPRESVIIMGNGPA
jgi:hypothetical protein